MIFKEIDAARCPWCGDIYFLMNRRKFPLWRVGGLKEEKILGYVDIHWYSIKNGGIGLPHLRLIDNMILPVYFVDELGIPVSQTVCVRFHKKFSLFWKNTRIQLISEDLWKPDDTGRDPWGKAVKFMIFNKGQKIGEGKLKHITKGK